MYRQRINICLPCRFLEKNLFCEITKQNEMYVISRSFACVSRNRKHTKYSFVSFREAEEKAKCRMFHETYKLRNFVSHNFAKRKANEISFRIILRNIKYAREGELCRISVFTQKYFAKYE